MSTPTRRDSDPSKAPRSPGAAHHEFAVHMPIMPLWCGPCRCSSHQREAHPREGKTILQKLGGLLKKTPRSNRYGVCRKCGDLHTNLTRHSSGFNQIPTATVPFHRQNPADGPSNRGPTASPAPTDTANRLLMFWGIEDVGLVLDALDWTTLTTMSLSTSKTVRQEHRMPFARSLGQALRFPRQAHNALLEAPADSPQTTNLVTNLHQVSAHYPGPPTVTRWTLQPSGSLQLLRRRKPGGPYRLAGSVCGEKPTRTKSGYPRSS